MTLEERIKTRKANAQRLSDELNANTEKRQALVKEAIENNAVLKELLEMEGVVGE